MGALPSRSARARRYTAADGVVFRRFSERDVFLERDWDEWIN
jgi:hypothetical protein